MSSKIRTKASAWAHKRDGAARPIEMVRIYRTATHVVTPGGSLPRAAYDLTRSTHPDMALPAFDDLPLHSSAFFASIQ
jgi:hypothetical protein